MALSASAWLVIPRVRDLHVFGSIARPVWLQVGGGVRAQPAAGPRRADHRQALDLSQPSAALLLVLGVGMALASGSWVLLQLRLVVGAARPWVPPLVGLTVVATLSLDRSATSDGLAIAMLGGGGAGLVVGLVMLAVELRHRGWSRCRPDGRRARPRAAGGEATPVDEPAGGGRAHPEPESWAEVALASGPALPSPLEPRPMVAVARPLVERVSISVRSAVDGKDAAARPPLPSPIVATRLPLSRETDEHDVARAPTGGAEASPRSGRAAVGPSHSVGPSTTRRCSWLWCTRADPPRACSWLRWTIRSATTR